MTSCLLDTNHVSALFKNDPKVIGRVSASQSDRFAVSVPTIAELWYMVFNSSRVARIQVGLERSCAISNAGTLRNSPPTRCQLHIRPRHFRKFRSCQ
jgi:hypothetical protein